MMDVDQNDSEVQSLEQMEGSTGFEQQASVVSWGRSDFGGLLRKNESDMIDNVSHFQLAGGRTIVAISSNIYHTAAVSATGELYTTGCNTQGQVVECADVEQVEKPRIVESLNNHRIVSVSCGLNHTVCVTASGCAISFGGNESGQLGHSAQKLSHVPPKVVNFILTARKMPLIVTKVSCGDLFTLFLTTTGEVYGCGAASYLGQAKPAQQIVNQAERIESFVGSNVIDIAAGAAHSLALVASGEMYGWGANSHCQLGFEQQPPDGKTKASDEEIDHQQTPKLITLPRDIGQVIGMAAGYTHSLIWTSNGYLLGAGSNKYGQLGLNMPRAEAFERIPLPYACTMAACGLNHSVVVCDSSLPTYDSTSTMTTTTAATSTSLGMSIETRASFANGAPITRMPSFATATASAEAALRSTAKVFAFGYNNFNQVTTTSPANMIRTPVELVELSATWSIGQVLYVAAGGDHSFAIGIRQNVQDAELMYNQAFSALPQALLRKKFSTLASKAVVAMSADQLLRLINRAAEQGGEEPRMIGDCLSTINEIFSSPSLLAGSFLSSMNASSAAALKTQISTKNNVALPPSVVTSIDIEGLEACYTALARLNNNAIARLLGAIQQTLSELEKASSNTSTLPETAIRVFLIILQAPIFADPVISADLMQRMVTLIAKQSMLFTTALTYVNYPSHIFASRLVKPIIEHLNYHVQSEKRNILQGSQGQRYDPDSPKVMHLFCRAASWLFAANQRKGYLVPVEQFYSKELSTLPDGLLVMDYIHWRDYRFNVTRNTAHNTAENSNNKSGAQSPQQTAASASPAVHNTSMEVVDPVTERDQTRFYICDYPYLLSAEGKRRIVLGEASMQQQHAQRQAVTQGIFGGSGFIMPFFLIPVEREHLLQQTLLHIANASQLDLKKPLKVIFINEEGIDEGGVKKEFFQLLTVQLFDLSYGMFTPTVTGRHIWFNSGNTWSVDEYRLVGAVLALAVYNNVLLDVHLPTVFYKKLLQIPLTLEDVETIDPELYRGLKQLLEFSPPELVEDTFCRNFTAEYEAFGEKITVNLVENGANINVTGDNRKLFVDKYVQWLLADNVQTQFQSLVEGFSRLLPAHQLLLFTPNELELLMVGMPHLDFKELEQHTEYIGDAEWNKDSETIRWFWQTVHENLNFDDKQKLLKFITGSNKAPIGGLKDIGLKIQRMGPDSNNLPTSHTCFNTLLLPQYSSAEKLRDRLLKAINECEGFGLK